MTKRLIVFVCLFVAVSAFADDRFVVRYNGAADRFAGTVAAAGGTIEWSHDGAKIAAVSGLTAESAAALKGASGVLDVVPNFEISVRPGTPTADDMADAEIASPSDPTTAARYPRQWHLRAIGAQYAWAAGRLGSSNVSVAVLDTGIAYEHPDLAGRVDLSRSVSFVPSDDALVAAYWPGKHPVTDLHYHGTHVAATISSNALAAAGVTSGVTLFGVKVLSVGGSGTFDAVLRGVLWAADHDADVANMSLGGGFYKAGNGIYVATVQQVFNYAHRKGTLMVVAAGNESVDLDHDGNLFKTYCSAANVVCVSATGPTASSGVNGPWGNVDAFAGYSNYGRSAINVAAPGGTGAGVVWEACSNRSLIIPVCQTGTFIVGLAGTSMATPHVSGLAALLVEDLGHGNPSQIKARLQQSADDLGQPGTDPLYGKGRINVKSALGL